MNNPNSFSTQYHLEGQLADPVVNKEPATPEDAAGLVANTVLARSEQAFDAQEAGETQRPITQQNLGIMAMHGGVRFRERPGPDGPIAMTKAPGKQAVMDRLHDIALESAPESAGKN